MTTELVQVLRAILTHTDLNYLNLNGDCLALAPDYASPLIYAPRVTLGNAH